MQGIIKDRLIYFWIQVYDRARETVPESHSVNSFVRLERDKEIIYKQHSRRDWRVGLLEGQTVYTHTHV